MELATFEPQGRRLFIRSLAGTLVQVTIIGTVVASLESCSADGVTNAGGGGGASTAMIDVSGLTQDGQAFVANVRGRDGAPVLVYRQSATEFVAMSMVCTHLGCIVDRPVNGALTCPCHGSRYSLSGTVLRGPATQPLRRYAVSYDGASAMLTVTF